MTKTQAIKNFLTKMTVPDLAEKYSYEMECQVNVAQDEGTKVEGDFKGKRWHGYTDGLTTWKSFRIPYKANSGPEFEDTEIKFDLAKHAEGIGMTGWNWVKKRSLWVAFDFDAIVGHSEKHASRLSTIELNKIQEASYNIPWVTIRRSTSGQGLHLYVFIGTEVETCNHSEHAALARAILGKMSAITGFDFQTKVDACGGNMWVWHRKMQGTNGLTLIKAGEPLYDIPENWKDHLIVVRKQSRKTKMSLPDSTPEDNLEDLIIKYPRVPLDEEHKRLINYLESSSFIWWWDQDRHLLATHTVALQKAHKDLNLRGFFQTNSPGTNLNEQNCFLNPIRKGGWVVRRFTPGVQEHGSWIQDGAGWTKCYLNRDPDLQSASRAHGGVEDPSGGFVFSEAEVANTVTSLLGAPLNLPPNMNYRKTKLKVNKEGRLIVEVDRDSEHDRADKMSGWLPKKGVWTRIFNITKVPPAEVELGNYDDIIRHIITSDDADCGWVIQSGGVWQTEPLTHIKTALAALGFNNNELTAILGSAIQRPWKLVNKPFQPEFPGDREWNRSAAQLRFLPSQDIDDLHYGTWNLILNHCGKGLDDAIQEHTWCKQNGIAKGADYLRCWIASLFQAPNEPLPYLFFFGPQNSGKSIFHEAISLLLVRGVKRADTALISQSGFNAELEGAILCVIEETDLRKNTQAYNRIKDWVTSREIMIHTKGLTPYHIPNTLHFVQTANDHLACPIFSGDTRITMCYVPPLENIIPKRELITRLEKEAPDFLASILNIELPPASDRLNIPIIETQDKKIASEQNRSALEQFVADFTDPCDGALIKFSEFYDKFKETLSFDEQINWTKIRVGRELPPHIAKGRLARENAQVYLANVKWRDKDIKPGIKFRLSGEFLIIPQ